MENVCTLLQSRHNKNFREWIKELNDLGYMSHYYPLNASKFELPQNSERLIMISVYVGDDKQKREMVGDYFIRRMNSHSVVENYCSEFYKKKTIADLLQLNYEKQYVYDEAVECTPNDTASRRKIWKDNRQIILPDNQINSREDVISTITTKQDRNPNSGNIYFESGIKGKASFQYLTPRECMLFMGFTNED